MEMETYKLHELCDLVIGRTPSRRDPELWGGEHSWLSIADMKQGNCIMSTKETISEAGAARGAEGARRNGIAELQAEYRKSGNIRGSTLYQ